VVGYQRFGCPCGLHFQGEAAWPLETFVILPQHYTVSQPRKPGLEYYNNKNNNNNNNNNLKQVTDQLNSLFKIFLSIINYAS
jgi:hypothetical protein